MFSNPVVSRTCLYFNECGRSEIYNGKRWQLNWLSHQGGWLCKIHFMKLIYNPKVPPEYRKKYTQRVTKETRKKWNNIFNPRKIQFKDKRIQLKENPRIGKCSHCSKKVGDEYINHKGELAIIKRMNMHHIEYHDDDPLKDTILLCNSCHTKESVRLRRLNK